MPYLTWKTRLTLSERLAPQGESTGVCLVKLESNWDTSSSEASTGLRANIRQQAHTVLHILEGRVQLPGNHIRPLDVLEEGVSFDGVSVRHTTA